MSASLDGERLAVLVHEVRSPVAALSAIAQTISDDELDASTRSELVRLVTLACRGIERIVTDAAVASIELEVVDPAVLVLDVVAAARLRGVRVELGVHEGVPALLADPARLGQALDNLFTNAAVHGAHDGDVIVRLRADDAVHIEVSDRGPGIPAEDLDQIFELGVRLDPSRPGRGVGLALTRAIVEGHGGSLTVSSSLGAGSTFTISLPRVQAPAGDLPGA